MQKRRGNGEIERDLLSTFPHFLFIFSLSIHFLNRISQPQLRKLNYFNEETYDDMNVSRRAPTPTQ